MGPRSTRSLRRREDRRAIIFRARRVIRGNLSKVARLTLIGLLAALAGAVVGTFIWRGPFWFDGNLISTIQDGDRRLSQINSTRGLLLQLVVLLGGAATVIVTVRGYFLNRAGQITDRYSKAVGQLSSERKAERIGALFALERIMHDSERDHRAIVDIIANFIQELNPRTAPASPNLPNDEAGTFRFQPDDPRRPEPSAETQAAIRILARRPKRYESPWIVLGPASLQGASFTDGWVDGLHLAGSDLRSGDFVRVSVRTGISLSDCDLRGANFSSAKLTVSHFQNSDLRYTLLRWCDLRGGPK